jgi:hypothetical protein
MIELTMTCQSTIQDSTGQGQGNAFLTAVSREETDGYFVTEDLFDCKLYFFFEF